MSLLWDSPPPERQDADVDSVEVRCVQFMHRWGWVPEHRQGMRRELDELIAYVRRQKEQD